MQPGQVLFGQYVSGTVQLVIPRYQRPYEWSVERWIGLWRDISSAYRKLDPKPPASKRVTPPAHFMGPLILEDDGAHAGGAAVRRLVVDGQQRLLTLFVIHAAIRDHDAMHRKLVIEPDNDLAYIHSQFGGAPIERVELEKAYRDVWAAIASGDFVDEVPEQYATDNLASAYAFFRYQLWLGAASLDDYDPSPPPRPSKKKGAPSPGSYIPWGSAATGGEAVNLQVLSSVLSTGLKMLEIVLDANDEEASVVFETMNSKNTPLRQFDHLRNSIYVCMRARREQFHAKRWRLVEETLAPISYSSLRNPPEEQFFYEYMISLGEGRVNLKDLHREFMERVYRDLGYPPADEKQFEKRYAEPFARAALMYPLALGQANSATILNKKFTVPTGTQTVIREILSMSGGPPVPVVLRLLIARFDGELKTDQELHSALWDVQSFLVRMMLAGERLSPLRSVFMQVCGHLETDASVANVRAALKKLGWPTNDRVRANCSTTQLYSYGGGVMFPVLRGIEKQIAKAGAHSLPYGSGPDDYSIEHIFPQSSSIGPAWLADLKAWGVDTGAMMERRHVLGNLTAVTKYDNSKNARKSFDVKKGLVKSVAPIRLNDSILSKKRWTPAIVDARSKALAEAALKHWPRH